MPPYMFAELERKVAEKKEAGVDVISLGIGDPDYPTFPETVAAMQEAVADPANHRYPTNRGRLDFREAVAGYYSRVFGVDLDPEGQIIPALGSKECLYNLCFAFLDPDDTALVSDPGYPVYTGGPILAGANPCLLPLVPSAGFAPDFDAVSPEQYEASRLMFLNYPNNPTGAVVPEGVFERAIELAREHDFLIVHDNAYSEIVFDGYRAPSFLETPGADEVGIEVFSLSKGRNMTGWRCGAVVGNRKAVETYWRLKTNVDSGMFEAIQVTGAAALNGPDAPIEEMCRIYERRRDLVIEALRTAGIEADPPKATIYVWAPVPAGYSSTSFAEHALEEEAVIISPGSLYGPSGEGFFRISLTTPDEQITEAVERLARLRV